MIALKKVSTFIAASALSLNAFAPVTFAADSTTISGNGSFSTNTSSVLDNHSSTIVQDNNSSISNSISVSSNTGGNSLNDNTGGDSFLRTGDTSTTVRVNNMTNLNQVLGSNSTTPVVADPVVIDGNGSGSNNNSTQVTNHTSSVFQTNDADLDNTIGVSAVTGGNSLNRNTGGDVAAITGHAITDVRVQNAANLNWVSGHGYSAGIRTPADFTISGNGAASQNSIVASENHSSSIVQDNFTDIDNSLAVSALTGGNSGNDNTRGSVLIDSGMVSTLVGVRNIGSVNAASHFGSMSSAAGDTVRVMDNGAFSSNLYSDSVNHTSSLFQGTDESVFDVDNAVAINGTTGANVSDRNTLGTGDSVASLTGHSVYTVGVENTGNANMVGSFTGFQLPNGTTLNFGFDWNALFNGWF